jgi:hypothetical protein
MFASSGGEALIVLCVAWLVFAPLVGAVIGRSKGREGEGAIWGLLLGVIGWIIVALLPEVYPYRCPECDGGVTAENSREAVITKVAQAFADGFWEGQEDHVPERWE